jgi:hypothetical protein
VSNTWPPEGANDNRNRSTYAEAFGLAFDELSARARVLQLDLSDAIDALCGLHLMVQRAGDEHRDVPAGQLESALADAVDGFGEVARSAAALLDLVEDPDDDVLDDFDDGDLGDAS